jgi:predicted metal-dependent phosphoesterase TrpH
MTAKINFHGEELNTYKANLHMHSTSSDGKISLPELVNIYCKEGYDILAATDHYKANRVSEMDTGDLLLMSGMEFHPAGPRGIMLHLVALNVPENFKNPSELPYQEGIERVLEAGGECILAHPYWSGFNCIDIMKIKNIIGIEVYNTSTRYIGKAYNMQVWDNILQLGYHLPAIAVDDTHSARDLFRGWTMICAKEKTPAAVMEALKSGSFYASQGPDFHKISFENNIFSIECSPCEEVIVMSNGSFGRCGTVPGFEATTAEEINKTKEMTSFETEIPSDAGLTYIRCQIKDKEGRYAWSNPIRLVENR